MIFSVTTPATGNARHDRCVLSDVRAVLACRHALTSMLLARIASVRMPNDQLTTLPSKQSTTGDSHILPAGRWNYVISVSHS